MYNDPRLGLAVAAAGVGDLREGQKFGLLAEIEAEVKRRMSLEQAKSPALEMAK